MAHLKGFSEEYYSNIIFSNSPWLKDPEKIPKPQAFRREAYYRVQKQLKAKHQMAVLIKGPRRVGKTEIQKQLIYSLIKDEQYAPTHILYLSLDDVQIQAASSENRWRILNDLLNNWANFLGFDTFDEINVPAFCFLDEVQAVDNWATFIKNRVDRNPHVRIILSGSAAHSIFKKALEILLGRVISEDITTFSFREFLQKDQFLPQSFFDQVAQIGREFERDLSAPILYEALAKITKELDAELIQKLLQSFLILGGFPQIWQIEESNIIEKARLIDENYVKKVTLEDLMLLRKIRKPELFERLLRHLFARPGQEYNQKKVASELGTTIITLADAIDLLKQTNLLLFLEKFSSKAEPLQRKNLKIYPVDLTLTFAMTKKVPSLEGDDKGYVAESLVAQTIFRLKGISNVAFLQTDSATESGEIDFYVRSDTLDCPIEVKYQPKIHAEDVKLLRKIIIAKNLEGGILITPDQWLKDKQIYSIPLWAFLLIA